MGSINEELLLEEIRQYGVGIDSINDLIYINKKDKDLIPFILKYLVDIMDDYSDKAYLVRCLGVKGFTEASLPLLNEFYKSKNDSYKWAIANTLSIIQDKSILPQMIDIVKNKEHGTSRQMIVNELWRYNTQEVKDVLISLLDDEDVQAHAIYSLSRMKDRNLIPYIQPYTTHKRTLVRNEAKKGVIRLEKYSKN